MTFGVINATYAKCGCSNPPNRSAGNNGQTNQSYPYGQQQKQGEQQDMMASSECSNLSDQEQQFARQLSDMHRTMFCRHFSVSQRMDAMTLASSTAVGPNGKKTSVIPDESVEIVMKNSRQQKSNGSQGGMQQQAPEKQSPYGNGYPSRNGQSSSSPYSNYRS